MKARAIQNRSRQTWVCFPYVDGKRTTRTLGLLTELTQQQANGRAEEMFRSLKLKAERTAPKVSAVVEQYRAEKMPKRYSTRRVYEVWLRKHIVPMWGENSILDLKARAVDLWLGSLPLSPKSRSHVRGLLHKLWNYAMYAEMVPTQANPIELVTVPGASQRLREPHNFTEEGFNSFILKLENPYNIIVRVQICEGLRISEALALKWSDVDWLRQELNIERSIVRNRVDTTKTANSAKRLPMDAKLLKRLESWRQETQFSAQEDWVFASPAKLGRLPWSYDSVQRQLLKAADGKIPNLGTHSMRHTFRTWLDALDTNPTVQQAMMRHADIRTTMRYGKQNRAAMKEAHGRVVALITE